MLSFRYLNRCVAPHNVGGCVYNKTSKKGKTKCIYATYATTTQNTTIVWSVVSRCVSVATMLMGVLANTKCLWSNV
jgi:hypothetical protein